MAGRERLEGVVGHREGGEQRQGGEQGGRQAGQLVVGQVEDGQVGRQVQAALLQLYQLVVGQVETLKTGKVPEICQGYGSQQIAPEVQTSDISQAGDC